MATSSVDISTLDRVTALPTNEQPTESPAAAYSCMIITSRDSRRDMFVSATEKSGWDVIQRATAPDAAQQSRTSAPHLMIVDLADGESTDECRALLESMSERDGTLLLVCGSEGDAMEEIWARGLGVWLYLPGVSDAADLSGLCADALAITQRNAPQTFTLPAAERRPRRLAR